MSADDGPTCFVLQCDQCRTIVGDSFSIVCGDLNAVVLSTVQMVDVEAPSTLGAAEAIICAHCKAPLGEIPVDRPEANINGNFLFLLSATRAYTLGSTAPELAEANGAAAAPQSAAPAGQAAPNVAAAHTPEDEHVVVKLQQILINHSARIAQLEAQLEGVRTDQRAADQRQRGGGPPEKHGSKRGRRPSH